MAARRISDRRGSGGNRAGRAASGAGGSAAQGRMMRRWLTSIMLAVTLVAGMVFALAGCGSQKRTIPNKQAQSFLQQLDNIGSQFDNGACTGAGAKVDALEAQVRNLPSSVDSKVKRNLED